MLSSICSKPSQILIAFCFVLSLLVAGQTQAAVYLSSQEFVTHSFDTNPKLNTIWLTPEMKGAAARFLGHPYQGIRLRYWQVGQRTAWIIEEIGKERPITIGVVIDQGAINRVEILEYRESRGGEVRHPFFTQQFAQLFLTEQETLSQGIDGISGATLSVRAVTNVSRLALYLHNVMAEPTNRTIRQPK